VSRNLLLAGTSAPGGYYGGSGGSYLSRAFARQYLFSGSNSGDGCISIMEFTGTTVPEPPTWAMTLAGFAGLGWLARLRKRKTECA
jgi:hypothetical protein